MEIGIGFIIAIIIGIIIGLFIAGIVAVVFIGYILEAFWNSF